MKKAAFLLLLSISSSFLFAQFSERIASARPGQANGPFGVGKNVYQLQSGLTYNNYLSKYSGKGIERENWFQNSIVRIGVAEKTEVRAGYSYSIRNSVKSDALPTNSRSRGFENFFTSIRQNLFLQRKLIPATALQFTLAAPGFSSSDFELILYEFKAIFQHRLSKKSALNTNFALVFNRNLPSKSSFYRYVISFRHSLTDKVGLVTEAYGTIDNGNTELLFDAGFSYLINNNFQLDLFGGYDIDKNESGFDEPRTYFISSGISYRLSKRD